MAEIKQRQTIESFNVSWQADHEQYYRGHGIVFTEYTHCATGVGETLREAFEDSLEQLADSDGLDYTGYLAPLEDAMLAELTAQVKEPEMLDWTVVQGYCDAPECCKCGLQIHDTEFMDEDEPYHIMCPMDNDDAECAVCAGEWHYYVSIDVRVKEEN